jgi:ubiquinol-cytochrome c reductase iron-sulfur subunit
MTDQHNGAGRHGTATADAPLDLDDDQLTLFDLVKEGARRDGVEIAHYAPRFPEPGTNDERRVVRRVAGCLGLSGLAATAFVVIYVAWPWKYEQGYGADKFYTPLLGVTMGLALLGIGAAVILWALRLLPEEVSIQDRHDGASPPDERRLTAAALINMADDTGIQRRPLLKFALLGVLLPVSAMAVVPLGALIKNPFGHPGALFKTGWAKGVRMVRLDGTAVRPADVSAGSLETVFPGIPGGTTNEYADSPTLLVHLREADAARVKKHPGYENANFNNFYAYSKICTHAGCPASLFEQQTNRLLCPCHQSQFDVLDACRPIFGPATRRLPQLGITVDDEGFFVAQSDYRQAIGPAFWERP